MCDRLIPASGATALGSVMDSTKERFCCFARLRNQPAGIIKALRWAVFEEGWKLIGDYLDQPLSESYSHGEPGPQMVAGGWRAMSGAVRGYF